MRLFENLPPGSWIKFVKLDHDTWFDMNGIPSMRRWDQKVEMWPKGTIIMTICMPGCHSRSFPVDSEDEAVQGVGMYMRNPLNIKGIG
jgi:hypothetical protein